MSEASREFFSGATNSGPEIGATEAAMEGMKEGVMAYREGLGKVWDALTPAFELGAEEFTRALYNGNAYVFHGDTIPQEQSHHEQPQHGLPVEPMRKQVDIEREM